LSGQFLFGDEFCARPSPLFIKEGVLSFTPLKKGGQGGVKQQAMNLKQAHLQTFNIQFHLRAILNQKNPNCVTTEAILTSENRDPIRLNAICNQMNVLFATKEAN
jgi:hypothetical protein